MGSKTHKSGHEDYTQLRIADGSTVDVYLSRPSAEGVDLRFVSGNLQQVVVGLSPEGLAKFIDFLCSSGACGTYMPECEKLLTSLLRVCDEDDLNKTWPALAGLASSVKRYFNRGLED